VYHAIQTAFLVIFRCVSSFQDVHVGFPAVKQHMDCMWSKSNAMSRYHLVCIWWYMLATVLAPPVNGGDCQCKLGI